MKSYTEVGSWLFAVVQCHKMSLGHDKLATPAHVVSVPPKHQLQSVVYTK